jgi:hypothetical protein
MSSLVLPEPMISIAVFMYYLSRRVNQSHRSPGILPEVSGGQSSGMLDYSSGR